MNCFLFDEGKRRNWPTEMGVGVGVDADAANGGLPAMEYEARLPQGWSVPKTRAAILKRHPALEGAFGRGMGYRLMYQESEILIAVLEELRGQSIVALGLHDGLLVARSQVEKVRTTMEATTLRLSGQTIPVSLK